MDWQLYQFEDLPLVARADLRARRASARLLPEPEARQGLIRVVAEALTRLRGSGPNRSDSPCFAGELQGLAHGPAGLDTWTAGPHTVRIEILLGRDDLRAVLEFPLGPVRAVLGAVVEVAPERLGASDLLTEVERGMLAYLADRVACLVTTRLPSLAPLTPLVIRDVVTETCPPDWGAPGPAGWYAVSAVAGVAGVSLPLRLLVPVGALEVARRAGVSPGYDAGRVRRASWLRAVGSAPVTFAGHLGSTQLPARELGALEVGDVLVFAPGVEIGQELSLRGPIDLVTPDDGLHRIEGEILEVATGRCVLRLREFRGGEGGGAGAGSTARVHFPGPGRQTDCEEQEEKDIMTQDPESTQPPVEGDAVAAGRRVAEDIPIDVRVELGRMRLTVRELAELTPGAIVELHRDPAAPVALVVGDRIVASGDLVRVDGELGVRIASLR